MCPAGIVLALYWTLAGCTRTIKLYTELFAFFSEEHHGRSVLRFEPRQYVAFRSNVTWGAGVLREVHCPSRRENRLVPQSSPRREWGFGPGSRRMC